MLFNSYAFIAFFAAVLVLYFAVQRNYKWQNFVLLGASYWFYGQWDARFLGLLAASTIIDYFVGRRLHAEVEPGRRRGLLGISLAANLGILGFFKYFNFFAESATDLLGVLGLNADPTTLNIILPVGISFYTFQTLSYTFDIYRRKLEPVGSFTDFALFVAFFPQLVAGPIERASRLLPQIVRPRVVDIRQINAGVFLMLWGYFKKAVIADQMALLVQPVFASHTAYDGAELLIALLAFTVQIYCDFSGYSDIARGVAKILGFDLMINFKLPYFALNPSDFWLRWHVSLSTWLRDYLYIPLGGNRGGTLKTQRNLAITMLLGGLWHGAAWNFIIWGAWHGTLLALYRRFDPNPVHDRPIIGNPARALGQMGLMFVLTVFGWLLFRVETLDQIPYFMLNMAGGLGETGADMIHRFAFFSWPLLPIQIWQYRTRNLLAPTTLPAVPRLLLYAAIFAGIVIFGVRESMEFIYFQF